MEVAIGMAAYDANSPSLLVFAKAGDKKKESPRGMSLFERFKWPRLRCGLYHIGYQRLLSGSSNYTCHGKSKVINFTKQREFFCLVLKILRKCTKTGVSEPETVQNNGFQM